MLKNFFKLSPFVKGGTARGIFCCSSALLLYRSTFSFHFSRIHASRLHASRKKSPLPLFRKEGFLWCVFVFNYPLLFKGELQGGFSAAPLLFCSAALLLFCSSALFFLSRFTLHAFTENQISPTPL